MAQESDSIDYLRFVRPLGKHLALIALLALFAFVISFVLTAVTIQSAPYEAQTTLLLTNNTRFSLDPRFSDENLDPARQFRNAKPIVMSLDVAEKVQEQARAVEDPQIRALASRGIVVLRSAISADVRGDLLTIKASDLDPEVATWLANAWAQESVRKLNEVSAPSSSESVSQALTDAKVRLDAAQEELERFLATNPISLLTQKLDQVKTFLDEIAKSNSATRSALYNIERETLREKLDDYHSYLYQLEEEKSQIEALRTRIGEGTEDPDTLYANQVALLTLLNRVVNSSVVRSSPGAGTQQAQAQPQLEISLGSGEQSNTPRSKASQLESVNATLAAVERLQDQTRGQIRELESRLNQPWPTVTADQVATLPEVAQKQIDQVNELQSQIEEKTFQQTQLQSTRDLYQNTYNLLRNRLAEQEVNQHISNFVSIATKARYEETVTSRSALRRLSMITGLSLIVGLLLGVGVAFLLSLLRPNFNSNAALAQMVRRGARKPVRVRSTAHEVSQ